MDPTVAPVSLLQEDTFSPEQLIAAMPGTKETPVSLIKKRLNEIECHLNSMSTSTKKRDQS